MFLKDVSYAHQTYLYFDEKYSKNSNIFKYYYNLKQYFSILFKYNDGESSVSYDHSEIILIC